MRADDKEYNTANRLQPKTNALAINPCYKVDKLIACTVIVSPVSNMKEPSVKVTLQQMGNVSKYKAGAMLTLDTKGEKKFQHFSVFE